MSLTAVVEGNEIKYHVMDPTGNITILVETPVEEASQPFIAAELMQREPEAEQVGFLTIPEKRAAATGRPDANASEQSVDDRTFRDIDLRMAGGEFCGNATMSAAAFYAARNGMQEGTVTVRVSGAAEPVPVEICLASAKTACGPDLQIASMPVYRGTVTMPRPVAVTEVKLPDHDQKETYRTYPVVHFEGIDHVILEENADRSRAEELAPLWCRELQAEAVGLMFLNRSEGTLTPLVYVPEAGTLVWENSCASGTSAVGAWAASRLQAADQCTSASQETAGSRKQAVQPEPPGSGQSVLQLSLQEPGGTLCVEVCADGVIRLTGTVRER